MDRLEGQDIIFKSNVDSLLIKDSYFNSLSHERNFLSRTGAISQMSQELSNSCIILNCIKEGYQLT